MIQDVIHKKFAKFRKKHISENLYIRRVMTSLSQGHVYGESNDENTWEK